jgi:sulfatase maturation enzyme AslB (radical SAM superfamily)
MIEGLVTFCRWRMMLWPTLARRAACFAVLLLASQISSNDAFVGPVSQQTKKQGFSPTGVNLRAQGDLPDYGSTSLDIDKHRLEKKAKWIRKDLFGTTLLDQTLEELESDRDFQDTANRQKSLGIDGMTKEERLRRRRALDSLGVPDFQTFLAEKLGTVPVLQRKKPQVLQLNIGLYCNQACRHCHVESSPLRSEMMSAATAARCLELLKNTPSISTLDITGGAPELNENFRFLVQMARRLRPDIDIIDRCNLTVLQEPGQEDLVTFLKDNRVHIIASLPCYSAENVDTQRGNGVFERSISSLLALNEAGYGSELPLDLVYNPLGAFLPPPQDRLGTSNTSHW